MRRFNLRVYGILINDRREVLLSHERRHGRSFTKFPGGGLEFGEGITDCLRREFMEELGIAIKPGELFYLTDFFQESAFNPEHQLISFYYAVDYADWQSITMEKLSDGLKDHETFFWMPLSELSEASVTFPIDKIVARKLKANSHRHFQS